jgi:hypothetical protein
MRQKIAEQMAGSKKQDAGTKDSLQQADQALQGLEKGEQPGQEKGATGGGIGSDLQQKGEGQGKESKGSGGEGKGDKAVIAQQERQDGKPNRPTKGEEKGGSEGNQGKGESTKQDPNTKGESEGAKRGETEGRSGKTQEGDLPTGPPPERYRQAGEEGEKGLKGTGYVTVELPEAGVSSTGGGRGDAVKTPRQNFPVSNVPLPPGSGPEGAREKQPVPLEYRGLIR